MTLSPPKAVSDSLQLGRACTPMCLNVQSKYVPQGRIRSTYQFQVPSVGSQLPKSGFIPPSNILQSTITQAFLNSNMEVSAESLSKSHFNGAHSRRLSIKFDTRMGWSQQERCCRAAGLAAGNTAKATELVEEEDGNIWLLKEWKVTVRPLAPFLAPWLIQARQTCQHFQDCQPSIVRSQSVPYAWGPNPSLASIASSLAKVQQ